MITRTAVLFFIILLSTLLCASFASAWDVSYEGNVLPNSSGLGTARWNVSYPDSLQASSTDGNVLHLVDNRTDSITCIWREGLPAGTAATIEARVKVLAADNSTQPNAYAVGFGVSAGSVQANLGLWPDKIGVRRYNLEDESEEPWFFHSVDLTSFHTLRLAMTADAQPQYRIWMDGNLIFSGQAVGGFEAGFYFGSPVNRLEATSESYWDYVRYSKSYEPVPEPAALVGLMSGLGALGVLRGGKKKVERRK